MQGHRMGAWAARLQCKWCILEGRKRRMALSLSVHGSAFVAVCTHPSTIQPLPQPPPSPAQSANAAAEALRAQYATRISALEDGMRSKLERVAARGAAARRRAARMPELAQLLVPFM